MHGAVTVMLLILQTVFQVEKDHGPHVCVTRVMKEICVTVSQPVTNGLR